MPRGVPKNGRRNMKGGAEGPPFTHYKVPREGIERLFKLSERYFTDLQEILQILNSQSQQVFADGTKAGPARTRKAKSPSPSAIEESAPA